MYKRVLVPLDGSKLAEQILPSVRSIAAWSKATVELLFVVDIGAFSGSSRTDQQSLDIMCAHAASSAEKYLNDLARGLSLPDGQVHTFVRIGNVADTILERAGKETDTLVAMSTHGRSGIVRMVLGSMADKVLHGTSAPLWLFHPSEHAGSLGTSHLTSMIVPLDGSELAELVLPHAASVAQSMSLTVMLVMVTPTTLQQAIGYAGIGMPYIPENILSDVKDWALAYLDVQAAALKNLGVRVVTVKHLKGDAGSTLVDLVRGTPNSMVALATHGHSGLRRATMGSVTNKVVRQASVPTLVIRPQ